MSRQYLTLTVGDIPRDQWVERWPFVRLDQLNDEIVHMDVSTMNMFNRTCKYASERMKWNHRINSSYRAGDPKSHGKGKALDVVFYRKKPGDVDVLEQLVFALQFDWHGVGFYPYWNAPGLHLDMRIDNNDYREIWWRDKRGVYHPGFSFIGTYRGEWT